MSTATPAVPARVSVREPVSKAGYVDVAWWPHTRDLAAELPALLDVLGSTGHAVTRVSYHLGAWEPAPRKMRVSVRVLRLGGFATGDPLLVRLTDSEGRDAVDVLVVAPDTDAALAAAVLDLARTPGDLLRPAELLAEAGRRVGGAGGVGRPELPTEEDPHVPDHARVDRT